MKQNCVRMHTSNSNHCNWRIRHKTLDTEHLKEQIHTSVEQAEYWNQNRQWYAAALFCLRLIHLTCKWTLNVFKMDGKDDIVFILTRLFIYLFIHKAFLPQTVYGFPHRHAPFVLVILFTFWKYTFLSFNHTLRLVMRVSYYTVFVFCTNHIVMMPSNVK